MMIEIKNLTKTFDGKTVAVNNLSVDINKGINGLIGENGAGKSTLLRLIAGVYRKDAGSITIDGKDNEDKEVKSNLFFLSDNPLYSGNALVKDMIKFYGALFDLDENKFYELMDKLSLPVDRRVSTFSKGMRRQMFICISLSMKAEYILLDEAFDGLDPIVLDVIKEEIIKSSEEKTFIVSSHNLASLERLCDNFILLSKGRCTKEGRGDDLGQSFRKYQIIFEEETTEEDLLKLGINILSFKRVGSICYVVVDGEEQLEGKVKTKLLESVALTNDEIIMLEMMAAKKGENK